MIEKYSALKQATAAIIRRREELEERLRCSRRSWRRSTPISTSRSRPTRTTSPWCLIQKKNQLEAEVAERNGDIEPP